VPRGEQYATISKWLADEPNLAERSSSMGTTVRQYFRYEGAQLTYFPDGCIYDADNAKYVTPESPPS
jgi:hypothetical protein